MTDKERLEDIKFYACVSNYTEHSNREAVDDLKPGDFQWLIEQAEKVEKLKGIYEGTYTDVYNENQKLIDKNYTLKEEIERLEKENNAMKSLLNEIGITIK